jgi:hypothetical protein
MDFINIFKPAIPKRGLLFIAAIVWTFAGLLLLYKGFIYFVQCKEYLMIKIFASCLFGALFYLFLFSKISTKHVRRIFTHKSEKPCVFAFFNIRSYILMSVMITSGILIRKYEVLSPEYLPILYVSMGIPLLLSSFKFYYFGIKYPKCLDRFI